MRILGFLILLFTSASVWANGPRASFTENKGQWPAHVLYRVMLPRGALYVERGAFTYVLQTGGAAHEHGLQEDDHTHTPLISHAFRVHFEGGRAQNSVGSHRQPHYENFFLGNDPAMWGTGCAVFGEVLLNQVWPGIDLRIDGRTGLKYELILAPGVDPSVIRMRYEGQDGLDLKDGALHVRTTAGTVVEEAPVSWGSFFDGVDNHRIPTPSSYRLQESTVSFDVKGMKEFPLTIDPTLSFASYIGSSGNNFGFTATYDAGGHLYGGGIVFEVGYPITLGVLDDTFNGGTIDVGISKWTPDGSGLVWSTYFGGTGNEGPHSMVVNENDELFVLGSTGSADLPTTLGCVDNSFAGGAALPFTIGYGFEQPDGTDMFVAHFNNTATVLIGSTYMGGTENDGLNNDPTLAHNYGDTFRGEIIVDANGDPVVASTTFSVDMPVVGGGPQAAYGGGTQDGYCFRLDPGLTTVLWSTYVGGAGTDAAYGVQVDSGNNLFVTGGTTSANLPQASAPFQGGFSGVTDGFIMRYAAGGALSGSTFLGTNAYDQCYFVQLNTADEVFVVGQTRGNYPISAERYAVAGSTQFIHKLNNALTNSLWSTRFGSGASEQDLSPTAFLVSNCGQIYFSGWGGVVNGLAGNVSSSTTGTPVTADAFQTTTDGSDFYLMLLEPEAVALSYATFFGGNQSAEHVDGGTSRFDKNGTVYQAVCAGCQGNDDFPTTPGAWSNTNNSFGCNLGVLKFDLARGQSIIALEGPSELCLPGTAAFSNNSIGGDTYEWDFGNGSFSFEPEPTVTYTTADTFMVSMILTDASGCNLPDTANLIVTIVAPPEAQIEPVEPFCSGTSVDLLASGGDNFAWTPEVGLSNPSVSNPVATPTGPTEWMVVISNQCGSDTASITLTPGELIGSAGEDQVVCLGGTASLLAEGGETYLWSPDLTLSDLIIPDPFATPNDTTTYFVTITTTAGCIVLDSVTVDVVHELPQPALPDTTLCIGRMVQLIGPVADSYSWENSLDLSALDVQDPMASPSTTATFVLLATNICGSILDSALVEVIIPEAEAYPDSIVCPGMPFAIVAVGGSSFLWNPSGPLTDATARSPWATVYEPTTFTVRTTDDFGCSDTASIRIRTHPQPDLFAGEDQVIYLGQTVQLSATGNGTFLWQPAWSLDRNDTISPLAKPTESTTYTVTLTDANGCKATDAVTIILNGSLFVPNTFSPNGDQVNDVFGVWGSEIKTLRLSIFNRWGELIFTGASLDARWDGTYMGKESQIDTYEWKVDAVELSGKQRSAIGHVNLVR